MLVKTPGSGRPAPPAPGNAPKQAPPQPLRAAPPQVTSRQAERIAELQRAAEDRKEVTKRRLLAGTAAGFFAGCACQICGTQIKKWQKPDKWTYEPIEGTLDQGGPAAWGRTCAFGTMQSPIDLQISSLVSLPPNADNAGMIVPHYRRTPNCTVSNTGHGTMQVTFPKGNTCTIGNREYDLLQFHFHTPSEHMFDGARYPLEAHLVHREQKTGALAVLGVMMRRGVNGRDGRTNWALRNALETAPKTPGEKVTNSKTTFDPSMLLPRGFTRSGKLAYIKYSGSLTTPPCSEKVGWHVFTEPVVVSDDDVLDFEEYCGGKKGVGRNARPPLPLNNRKLVYFNDA